MGVLHSDDRVHSTTVKLSQSLSMDSQLNAHKHPQQTEMNSKHKHTNWRFRLTKSIGLARQVVVWEVFSKLALWRVCVSVPESGAESTDNVAAIRLFGFSFLAVACPGENISRFIYIHACLTH